MRSALDFRRAAVVVAPLLSALLIVAGLALALPGVPLAATLVALSWALSRFFAEPAAAP